MLTTIAKTNGKMYCHVVIISLLPVLFSVIMPVKFH